MEPTLTGYGNEVIYSPTTAVMDTKHAMQVMRQQLVSQGVTIEMGQKFVEASQGQVKTETSRFEYDYLINAAGLDSLRIAK